MTRKNICRACVEAHRQKAPTYLGPMYSADTWNRLHDEALSKANGKICPLMPFEHAPRPGCPYTLEMTVCRA